MSDDPALDKHGFPNAYTKQPKRDYWTLDDKDFMPLDWHPVKGKMADALQMLAKINHDRALLEGNRLVLHEKTLYIPTATGQALWRRKLVAIWEEQNSYVKQTFIELTQAGHDWLRDNAPKEPKKLTKRQKKREVDHLLEVLAGRGEEDGRS